MPKTIQLRNVPDDLHRKLKMQAAERGMMLSSLLLEIAENAAVKPSLQEMRERLEQLEADQLVQSPAAIIRRRRSDL